MRLSKSELLSAQEVLRDLRESDIVEFSRIRKEPQWVLERRLEAYRYLKSTKPEPGVDDLLEGLAYRVIIEGYLNPSLNVEEALSLAERIGMPKNEIEILASALSLTVDNRFIKAFLKFLEKRGIVLESMDEAVKKYDIVKDYMFKLISPKLNRKAAYHVMLWSGGPFVYVPKSVKVPQPIYSLFILGLEGLSQTEHTLIIADENSLLTWIEGCTAPLKVIRGAHLGALEGFVKAGSKLKVVSINNWVGNINHMPLKRLRVLDEGSAELSTIGFWAKNVRVAPEIEVVGDKASGTIQNIGFYTGDQKVFNSPRVRLLGKGTKALILNRTVVTDSAFEEFRGTIKVEKGARDASGYMSCNTLLLGDDSRSVTVPALDSKEKEVDLSHEASVGRVDYEKLFYLSLSGFTEEEAIWMLVSGFFEPVLTKLPGSIKEEVRRIVSLALQAH